MNLFESDQRKLRDIVRGHMIMQAVATIVRLKIPKILSERASTLDELVEKTGAVKSKLRRLLNGLQAVGIVERLVDGSWELTSMGMILSDENSSLASLAAMNSDPYFWNKWSSCTDIVLGKKGLCSSDGDEPWESYDNDSSEFQIFDKAMEVTNSSIVKAINDKTDLSQVRKIVDIGGGRGQLLSGILKNNVEIEGVVTDRPATIEKVSHTIHEGASLNLRWESCDFFRDPLPPADIHILKDVIHNWSDSDVTEILRNCRNVMNKNSRLWIIENLYNEAFYWMDIHLMVSFDGAVRSEEDIQNLCNKNGLKVAKKIELEKQYTLLEIVTNTSL